MFQYSTTSTPVDSSAGYVRLLEREKFPSMLMLELLELLAGIRVQISLFWFRSCEFHASSPPAPWVRPLAICEHRAHRTSKGTSERICSTTESMALDPVDLDLRCQNDSKHPCIFVDRLLTERYYCRCKPFRIGICFQTQWHNKCCGRISLSWHLHMFSFYVSFWDCACTSFWKNIGLQTAS